MVATGAQAGQIRDPLVIISDHDTAFRAACRSVYPDVTTQLCHWHVIKNVTYHVRMKWNGSLEGTELGRRMAPRGARRREENTPQQQEAAYMANRLVDGLNRHILGGGEPRRLEAPLQPQRQQQQPGRDYNNDTDSMLRAWKDTVNAPTEEGFNEMWAKVQREFADQGGRSFET